ncbi:uncharacterized protein EV422DRAFT_166243 [Fimicolochytrium jonesii]|uniref:uncharacterized protein n=1 Tax=Fimicolochytrium jonesii TaxID=1396493 RepID=UPI0022FF3735|nr:uncharacterized protein EV422DRAFT_166243 [Fimicolochytrium jonesii]KAI8818816.1 hypothetical protein EV422DRAFT_166243 [Fimicolochytrium jonesii]
MIISRSCFSPVKPLISDPCFYILASKFVSRLIRHVSFDAFPCFRLVRRHPSRFSINNVQYIKSALKLINVSKTLLSKCRLLRQRNSETRTSRFAIALIVACLIAFHSIEVSGVAPRFRSSIPHRHLGWIALHRSNNLICSSRIMNMLTRP